MVPCLWPVVFFVLSPRDTKTMTCMPVSLIASGHAYWHSRNVTGLLISPQNTGWAAFFRLSRNFYLYIIRSRESVSSFFWHLCHSCCFPFLFSTHNHSVTHLISHFHLLRHTWSKLRSFSTKMVANNQEFPCLSAFYHWCDFFVTMNGLINISHKQIMPCSREANLTIKLPSPVSLRYFKWCCVSFVSLCLYLFVHHSSSV